MNLNELEKELRDFRPSHPEKIDTDVLWDRVSPHIIRSKKKKRILPFILLFLSIALVGLLTKNFLSYSEKDFNLDKNEITNVESHNDASQNNTNNKVVQITKIGEGNSSDIIDTKKPNFTQNNNTEIVKNKGDKQNISKKQFNIDNGELFENRKRENISLKTQNANESINAELENGTNENNLHRFNNYQPSNFTENTNNEAQGKLNLGLEKQSNIDDISEDVVQADPKLPTKNHAEIQHSNVTEMSEAKSSIARQTVNVSTLLNNIVLLKTQNSEPTFLPRRISPYVFTEHPKVSLELGGSYLSPRRTLSLTNPEFSSELDNRQLSEEILEGWYASAAFRYNVTPQIGLNVGMQYGKINERSATSLSYTETLFLEDTIIGNLVRVDGTIEPIYGDIELDRTIMKNVNRINTYSFLQMPIELIYSQAMNRINIEGGFGIIQNISFKQSGYWHPDTNTEYDLAVDESGYLKSRIGLALTGRFGIGYDLTPGIGVYAHGRYIKHLSGITSTNYGIDQTYSLFGAELGLRFHLFN